MSRTYRFRKEKDNYMINKSGILNELVLLSKFSWSYTRIQLDPKSKKARKKLAKFHSDKKHGYWDNKGPSWFHREYAQCPYRMYCKQEIHKFFRDEEYEIQIRNKPFREYWT